MKQQSDEVTWFETTNNPIQKKTRGTVLFGKYAKDGSEEATGGLDAVRKMSLSKKEAQKRYKTESRKDILAKIREKKAEEDPSEEKRAFLQQLIPRFVKKNQKVQKI
jgi:hypothetical protein